MKNDLFDIEFTYFAKKNKFLINNINIYKEAFTHPSYTNENLGIHYERLEFLGDAILGFLVSEYIYKEKDLSEGEMTKLRAKYVCTKANAEYSLELGLDKLILLGHGAIENNEISKAVIADVFESFLGALYLDQGLNTVKELLEKLVFPKIEVQKQHFFIDYKSRLQEYFQAESRKGVTYQVVEESGPPHNKLFTVLVIHDNIALGKGQGKSKKEAEQKAAKTALEKLVR